MAQADSMERPAGGGAQTTQRARTQSTGSSTLVSDQGRTTIANGVVSKIAGLAAREIDGVHQLIGGGGAALSSFASRVTGADSVDRGVNVEVGEREAAVDLRMIVVYGASIPDVAQSVRQNITNRVRDMTGLVVKEINIDVIDLYFPGEEREEQPVEEDRAPGPPRRVE